MENKAPFRHPSLYHAGHLRDFDTMAARYSLQHRFYPKGSILTTAGQINNTAYYICSGLLHLSLTHSSGKRKGVVLFGHGTVFPIGVVPHENPIDYEMVLTAVTDVWVYAFSYPVLRRMCVENGEFAAQLLEENCDFIGYLFYQDMNQSYNSTYTRICDILYLYDQTLQEASELSLTQAELAELAGTSVPQLERVLKSLRAAGIIETARKRFVVKDPVLLLAQCSDDLQL